jgi:hypothetical protein
MDKVAGQLLTHARALRALCTELAHGAARDAFYAAVDAEIAALESGTLQIVVLAAGSGRVLPVAEAGAAEPLERLRERELARATGATPGPDTMRSGAALQAAGVAELRLVRDLPRVLASPLLWGDVVHHCDVVVLDAGYLDDDAVRDALAVLAVQARCAVCVGVEQDRLVASPFRDLRCWAATPEGEWLAGVARALPPDARALALAEGVIGRLGRCAELLQRHLQADAAAQKFRMTEVARLRRGEDAQEGGGDLREQTERLKAMVEGWARTCHADLARMAEHGILPFDPRLLANRLGVHELVHREEKSPAVARYPVLGHGVFQSMVSHTFVMLPDPSAVEQIRQRLVSALATQTARDAEVLNHRAQDLAARLRAGAPLYPQLAPALDAVRLPTLSAAALAAPVHAIALEVEVEDKLTRVGFFKRLMEGRMVASMAFSFVTMSAGVFVLFGEPNIKRGLMKFSGVIVIMMVLYFAFSMLVRREEEKHELEEVLERIRARLNQEVMRPLARVQQAILKAYAEHVDDVAATVLGAVESLVRSRSAERSRLTEQRKADDELYKAFVARRQQAAASGAQKLPAFVAGIERLRVELQKPDGASQRPASGTSPALASAVNAPTPGTALPAAATARVAATADVAAASPGAAASVAERIAAARAQVVERLASVRPQSASERLAKARAQRAETPAPAADLPAAD